MVYALQWCNGGHFYTLSSGACPDSGYADPSVARRLREVIPPAQSYAELIEAGVEEPYLLHLLLVDDEAALADAIVPCSSFSLHLAELVSRRNELILRAFPNGRLRDELDADPDFLRAVEVVVHPSDYLPGTPGRELEAVLERSNAFRRRHYPVVRPIELVFEWLFWD